jgi:hypothetical protein
MKKIFLFCTFIFLYLSSVTAQNDAINRYFETQLENENFTSVYVSPKLIDIVSQIDLQGLDDGDLRDSEVALIENVLEQLDGLMLLKTDVEPNKYYKEILTNFTSQNTGFDLLLSVRDKGNNVKMWTQTNGDIIQELLLLVGGEDEMIMLSLTGNIDLDKISRLAGNINIDGIEYLDNIEKKQ